MTDSGSQRLNTPRSSSLLAADLLFPEAPRWHDGELWFSDMLARRVCRISDGNVVTVADFDEMPGGLGFLPDGTPLVAGMQSGRLYTVRDGATSVYADVGQVKDGHFDDMVVSAAGTAYVGGVGVMNEDSLHAEGSIITVRLDGQLVEEATDLKFPNGCAITHDGATLLVNETFAEQVLAFDIMPSGSITNKRVWASLPGRHPDGLCVDSEGAAWVGCFSEHEFIRVLEGGTVAEVISSGSRWATGVALGGVDGRTLFMTSSDTDVQRFFASDAVGRIDTAVVDVPGSAAG